MEHKKQKEQEEEEEEEAALCVCEMGRHLHVTMEIYLSLFLVSFVAHIARLRQHIIYIHLFSGSSFLLSWCVAI